VIKKEVPNVVGMDEQTARDTLIAHGFEVDVDWEYSNDIAVDLVSSQDPKGGKDVKQGSKVTIYISKGKAPTTVPSDLVGMDVKVATYILEQAGFTVKVSYEYVSKDETEGLVLSVPQAGETIDYGSEVELVVSLHEGDSSGDKPAEKVYEYSERFQSEIPEGAKWYTYVLYDANNQILKEVTDRIEITDGVFVVTVGELNVDSGYIVVTWYEEIADADGDGTPDAEPTIQAMADKYTGETVNFTDVTPEPSETENSETESSQSEDAGTQVDNPIDEPATPEV
jgi:hypothetical protein